MGIMNSRNELFKSSNLIIQVCYTIFSTVLTVESLLLGWIIWPLIPICAGVIVSWAMFIKKSMTAYHRIWISAILLMVSFFYYGTYPTSAYDLAIVMAAVIMLFTVTGNKKIITMLQVTYFVTMAYCVTLLVQEGAAVDLLMVTRTMIHCGMVLMIGHISKTIIDKWSEVLGASENEINLLTESTERLNDFLTNVSHELRTPVNAVIGLTGVCIDKEEKEDIRRDMESVRSAGRRVAEQISDILDYSEIDRGKLVKNSEDYMVSSLMNDLINDLHDVRKPELELIIDIDPSIPAAMNSDVTKLKKILKSLITNGLKYTNEGGVYVKLDTEAQSYGVNLQIEVSDTGIGMTDEDVEHIYEQFYQADSGRSRIGGGLGLGMSIVRGFVSSMGGFMTVSSKVNEGTTVRVSIPQKVVNSTSCMSIEEPDKLCLAAFLHIDKFDNPRVREYYNSCLFNIVKGLGIQMHRVENAENLKVLCDSVNITHLFVGEREYTEHLDLIESMTSDMVVIVVANPGFILPKDSTVRILEKPFYCFPIVSALNSDISNKDITKGHMVISNVHALVVDDEPMNLIVAKSIFKRYGMKVTTANSGPESIEACRKELFDIIFMDHMMGGMDGVEAMKRIRADVSGLGHNVPIVALTANAMSSAKQMFMSVGFDGFVSKPIEIEELERVLKKLLPVSSISYVKDSDIGTESDDGKDDAAAPAVPATSQPTTLRGKLKAGNIDVETGLHYCAGDLDFYKTMLLQIASESKDKVTSLNRSYIDKDWKNYEIVIHAVKSTTKTIGALGISSDALALETAAKESNIDYIVNNHERVIKDIDNLRQTILSALDKEEDNREEEEEVLEFGPGQDDVINDASDSDDIFEFNPDGEDN